MKGEIGGWKLASQATHVISLFFWKMKPRARSCREHILKHRQCLSERRGSHAPFSSVGMRSDPNNTMRQVHSAGDRPTADLRGAKRRPYEVSI